MPKLLFAAHPTVGHTQALRAIGRELLRRGHTIEFAMAKTPRLPAWFPMPAPLRAAGALDTQLDSDGFARIALPSSLRALSAGARIGSARGYRELELAIELFTCDLATQSRLLLAKLLTRSEPRCVIVVADYLFYGAWLAAEAAGIPFAAVFHSGLPFPIAGEPPFGSGLTKESPRASWDEASRRLDAAAAVLHKRIAGVRQALGLPPADSGILLRPYAKALNVLTTFPEFELARPELTAVSAGPLLWAGPCLGSRAAELGNFPWERLDPKRPIVYVSLGTVFNGQPKVYAALLAGVRMVGAQAVVAAGSSFEQVRALASESEIVVRFAPQVALLERVDAVIGHGGNNSTNEALRAGKPLVIVPFGAEQIANGQRVTTIGAGRAIAPEHLTQEAVATALQTVLAEPIRSKCRAIAAAVPTADGAAMAATAIEALLSSQTSALAT